MMKSRLIPFFLLFFVSLFVYECKADWKKDLTELGFYAVIDGRAYHLELKNMGEGDTHRMLNRTEFGEIVELPSIKKNDFILLYGEMPKAPLDTTIEMFNYGLSKSDEGYRFQKSSGELDNFFKVIPLDDFRGRKLTKFIPKDGLVDGIYFFHKYVGLNSDAYLGFKIERFTKVVETEDMTSVPQQVDAFAKAKEKLSRKNLASLESAIAAYIAKYGKTPENLIDIKSFLRSAYEDLDGWGNPFKYERISDSKFRLISAGEDKTFNTEDDIIIKN